MKLWIVKNREVLGGVEFWDHVDKVAARFCDDCADKEACSLAGRCYRRAEQPPQGERERLRGVVARGYCSEKNRSKILDGDLLEAIVDELLAAAPQPQEQALREQLIGLIKEWESEKETEKPTKRSKWYEMALNRCSRDVKILLGLWPPRAAIAVPKEASVPYVQIMPACKKSLHCGQREGHEGECDDTF